MRCVLLIFFLLAVTGVSAQPTSVYYNHGGLYVNGMLLEHTISKAFVDSVFRAQSKNGTIIATQDLVLNKTEREKARAFRYIEYGVWYRRYIRDLSRFQLSVRLAVDPSVKNPKKDFLTIYHGEFRVGNTLFTKDTRLDTLLTDTSFRLVKKGDIQSKKFSYRYAVVSYQDIILNLLFGISNDALNVVEIAR